MSADSKSNTAAAGTGTAAPKEACLAIIGGSSFLESKYFASFTPFTVDTPFGVAKLRRGATIKNVIFVQRHSATDIRPYTPPHLLNPRAVIHALKELNCTRIIAFASVGSLSPAIPVGTLLLPDDFYNPNSLMTFFNDNALGHKVLTVHEGLRQAIIKVLKGAGVSPLVEHGVYAQTLGPRFESIAEIKALARDCHVVGMTCAHEMVLAAEIDMPYACISMIDNMANGISKPLLPEEWRAGVHNNLKKMETILGLILKSFADYAGTGDSAAIATDSKSSKPAPIGVDLMVHAAYIVTGEDANHLSDHTLVVNGGRIVELLPTADAESKYAATEVLRFSSSHVLMPGLVNAHTHTGMTLLRGYSDDKCLQDWLTRDIWPTEAQFMSPEFVRDSTLLACAEMLRGGTTCFNDMYMYPGEVARVADETGMRALVGCPLLDFPTAYAKDFDDYAAKAEVVFKQYKSHPRVSCAVAPHAPYTVCDAHLEKCKAMSVAHGDLRIHTHLHETKVEVVDSTAQNKQSMSCHRSDQKTSPLVNFNRLGLLSPKLIAVHMTQLTPEDIKLLAATKSNVAHCPTSNLKLSSGVCPVSGLLAAGVNVALGTDSSASNNALDMLFETKLAALLSKGAAGAGGDPTTVPAGQALQLATINGARAIGMDATIGSLKPGKAADFIAIHIENVEMLPLYDVVSHLVYTASRDRVTHAWVAGKCLLSNRTLTTIDEKAVIAKSKVWNAKIAAFRKEHHANATAAKK